MEYFSWGWTPARVAEMERAEQRRNSVLILPDSPQSLAQVNPAIVHFSRLVDGQQWAWLWLFKNREEAIALRLLPEFLPDSDPVGTLISATIPKRPPGKPASCYLQVVPDVWLQEWDLLDNEIYEVWLGFDRKRFVLDRMLQSAAQVFGSEEFQTMLRRSA